MASRTTGSTQDSTPAETVKGTKATTKSAAKTATRKATGSEVTAGSTPTAKAPATRKKSTSLASGGNAVQLTPEERQRYVSEAAYFIAERRGFAAGGDVEDWLQAESEIDQMLAGTTRH
jgi:hypothetical protein